jgi:Mg2+ and Co2+ transporter CorA
LILGAGAVLTGFFGMNFGGRFARLIFEPSEAFPWAYYLAIASVVLLSMGAIGFGAYVVAVNWTDYRRILTPRSKPDPGGGSLRRE